MTSSKQNIIDAFKNNMWKRRLAAYNENSLKPILHKLATTDNYWVVTDAVVTNSNVSTQALERLMFDNDEVVRNIAKTMLARRKYK